MILAVLVFPSILYGIYLWRKVSLWKARGVTDPGHLNSVPFSGSVSILLPVRNEEKNLNRITSQILNQKVNGIEYELIVINDGSTDGTTTILNKLESENKLLVINLETQSGKKAALTRGIEKSRGDIIVTIDADCLIEEHWLNSLIQLFSSPEVILVQGPVFTQPGSGLFSYFQFLESASLQVFTGADFNSGNPGMGNGANLAYKMSEFKKVGGFKSHQNIDSGDDVFLIHELNMSEGRLLYNFNKDSAIKTTSISTLSELFYQKIRWAGKWKYYKNSKLRIQGALVFFFNFYFLSAIIISIALSNIPFFAVILVYSIKALFEGILVRTFCSFVKEKFKVPEFLIMVFLYPFYAVFFGIASLFKQRKWK